MMLLFLCASGDRSIWLPVQICIVLTIGLIVWEMSFTHVASWKMQTGSACCVNCVLCVCVWLVFCMCVCMCVCVCVCMSLCLVLAAKHLVQITACGNSTNRVCHCAKGYYCTERQNHSCLFACKPCKPGTFSSETSLKNHCKPYTE